jgi:hypothetical protein
MQCLFAFSLMLAAASTHGQSGKKPVDPERDAFVKEILERMAGSGIDPDYNAVSRLYQQWKDKNDDQSWKDLNVKIREVAKEREYVRVVTIKTVNANGEEVRGLTIKYRPTWENKISTADRPTPCDEKMYLGTFYIWAERDGKPVSSLTSERRIKGRDSVEIVIVVK